MRKLEFAGVLITRDAIRGNPFDKNEYKRGGTIPVSFHDRPEEAMKHLEELRSKAARREKYGYEEATLGWHQALLPVLG